MFNPIEPYWARLPYILTGIDTVKQVGDLVKDLNCINVLVVTDKGVVKAGLLDNVQQSLEKSGIRFGIFDKCEPDAPIGAIMNCAQLAREGNYDLLIGLGGGSSLDTAKLTARVATEENISPDVISRYISGSTSTNKLRNIMIATTAGSGAEVSPGAVIIDTDGIKKGVGGCLADIAIVDPMMTLNLPAEITADTGIDALTHCLERYVHPKVHTLCETLGEMALKLIADNLRPAYRDGPDRLDVRYNMAIGATWSLAAGMMSPYGIMVHLIGQALQINTNINHGKSVSLMLPYVMEFNLITNYPKYARLAEIMGENVQGLPTEKAAMKSIDAVKKLSQDIGIPQRLRDIGVEKNQIPGFVDTLFTYYGNRLNSNPRPVSREEVTGIYEAAF